MFFRKKPHRLYIPTRSRWYTRPRSKTGTSGARRLLRPSGWSFLSNFFKDRLGILAGIFLGLFILLLILFSSYLKVTDIEVVRGNFTIDSGAITKTLNHYVGRNIVFLPRYQVIKTLQKSFPEFESIIINKKWPHTLQVNLGSYSIVANLRAYYLLPEPEDADSTPSFNLLEDPALRGAIFDLKPRPVQKKLPEPNEQKALLNRLGQAIFDQAENLELMTISLRGLSQPVQDREQVISPERMNYLLEALQYFQSLMGMEIAGIDFLPIAREIHFKIKKGPAIWITLEKDYKEQIDKFKTIYEPAELHKEEISYIDLRIREKVIYCPRSAPCAQ